MSEASCGVEVKDPSPLAMITAEGVDERFLRIILKSTLGLPETRLESSRADKIWQLRIALVT